MFNLDSNAFNNIREQMKSKNPVLGEFARKHAISILLDQYELDHFDYLNHDDSVKKVAAYADDLKSKSDEDLLFLLNQKGLI